MSTTNTCKVTMLVLLFFWAIVSDTLWPYNPVHAGASIDLDFTPLHPVLQWRHYVFALSVTPSVQSSVRSVPNTVFSLHKNAEWILIKFVHICVPYTQHIQKFLEPETK